jgi:serine/threonine protein kinase
MPIESPRAFIDTLHEHGLVEAGFAGDLRTRARRWHDARALARWLMRESVLTVYQVNEILNGRAAELVVGPYEVLDRLGFGGSSVVYKARQRETEQLVALKVIQPEILNRSAGRTEFLPAMEAMTVLEHPNVVQLCDADQSGELCYVAMEFMDGTDLHKLVRFGGPLPCDEACEYARQAAVGLQHAHEHNLVHRDIKPRNLFLTQAADGTALVKILDWGLAGLRAPRAVPGRLVNSVTAGIVGSADYLAPEQARDAAAVDIRGDIYSLGCTLYFLLTGRPPFPGGSLMQKLLRHLNEEPARLDGCRDDVPAAVCSVLERMLAKQPEERFQTPAAVAIALFACVNGYAVPPEEEAAPAPRSEATPLPIRLGPEFRAALARTLNAQRPGSAA